MATTYRPRKKRAKKKQPLPPYIWLLAGLAVGLFVAFIVYLDKQPSHNKNFSEAVQQELNKLKKQPVQSKLAVKQVAPVSKKEQKFKFYTLLPELEVFIPEEETRSSTTNYTQNSQAKNKTAMANDNIQNTLRPTINKQYLLQAGSFQNLEDAEKLKATIAFLGLKATVQHVMVNQQRWHRVRTGPYSNKEQLYQSKTLLKQNNILAISIQLK